MYDFASAPKITRFAGNVPSDVTTQTVGPTITAFTNGHLLDAGTAATLAGQAVSTDKGVGTPA